jgi:carbonic anhydrase/acetyltransferase-like protein (isoleucine patch superfamily)
MGGGLLQWILFTVGKGFLMRELRLKQKPQIAASAFIAKNATVIGDVIIGEEASIWFNTVIRGDTETITIGKHTNIQDGSVLHADPGKPCTIGDEVTVGHKAIVHGATVHNRVLVGMGAIVMNGAVVHEESVIGAGALVREGQVIPPRSLAIGMPAKVVRQLTEQEVAGLRLSAAHYVESGQAYKAEGY